MPLFRIVSGAISSELALPFALPFTRATAVEHLPLQDVHDLVRGVGVKAGGRLVKEQDSR